jgi:hypothetical protein
MIIYRGIRVPLSLCLPQISYELPWEWIRSSTVKTQLSTACAMGDFFYFWKSLIIATEGLINSWSEVGKCECCYARRVGPVQCDVNCATTLIRPFRHTVIQTEKDVTAWEKCILLHKRCVFICKILRSLYVSRRECCRKFCKKFSCQEWNSGKI